MDPSTGELDLDGSLLLDASGEPLDVSTDFVR